MTKAALVLSLCLCGAAGAAAPDDPDAVLKHADAIKTSDNSAFLQLLKTLDADAAALSQQQHDYLRYLKAWQSAYVGEYPSAIPELSALADQASDPTLRFRAGVTSINTLAIAARYEEAYRRLNQLIELLPQVQDSTAIAAGLAVSALLYNQAGQYDLGLVYADKLAAQAPDPSNRCKAAHFKVESLYKSGKLRTIGGEFDRAIDICMQAKEPVWANLVRTFEANLEIEQDRAHDAEILLKANYEEVQHTHYQRLISEFDSILARAYWKQHDSMLARQFALTAIEKAVKSEITKPLADAYEVLYQVTKQQADFENALTYHEKYAAADKGYLNDTSARTLAFQMVNQQVLDKKRQIDALNEKNQRLLLQQEVDAKTTEAARLYIALLILVLASIAFWAYKTKRSQLRFMRLARRDGLTGIFNRQHFIDAATDQLRYCAKSTRDACVIVIDLDHFKSVNDVYGHATGDLVLKRAVKTCEDRLRSIDIFGRLGGEEFGIVLPDCALEQALRCADGLRAAIAAVSGSDARIEFPVSASFGIAATHTSGYDLRELLANADSALYEAKRQGRDRVAAYESSNTVRYVEAAAKAAGTH